MSLLSLLVKDRFDEPPSGLRHDCSLCTQEGGPLIWKGAFWRLISAEDTGYPGFVRLVLNRHCAELTSISTHEQQQLFKLLVAIETQMRELLSPDKINIASLGNQVPHLHWHIVPRWKDDPCFPDSVWSAPQRSAPSDQHAQRVLAAKGFLEQLPHVCAKTVY